MICVKSIKDQKPRVSRINISNGVGNYVIVSLETPFDSTLPTFFLPPQRKNYLKKKKKSSNPHQVSAQVILFKNSLGGLG